MFEKGDKKLNWCDNYQYPGADVKGMYVFHKPTKHDALKARKMNSTKDVERNLVLRTFRALHQHLHLLLPLLLHLQMHPSYPLQSHFKKLSQLLLDSAKINSIRFGKTVVMPWETDWP
jgi:hypothetical protein